MRTFWRVAGWSLGFLLIAAVICALALPYLNHLAYTDALSMDDVERARTHGTQQAGCYAPNPAIREIDELGTPDHIQTEADAKVYVEAVMRRQGATNSDSDLLRRFEEPVARAEYAAVRDPQKLIPESQVVKTFNGLVDQWGIPSWAHVSVDELHAVRMGLACVLYPRSVARLPNGTIAPSCRPTEALFLLGVLNANAGVTSYIRDYVRESHFPWKTLKWLKLWHPAAPPRYQPGLHPRPPSADDLHMTKYMNLQRKYFACHPDAATSESIANELFSQLGIPEN